MSDENSNARLHDWYFNTIWGKRISDDNALFEVMSLEVFQAGLTWNMILNKRDGFRSAFHNWNIKTVACFQAKEIEDLRLDTRIIRNRLKIQATVENARTILAIQQKHSSFCNWFYNVLQGNEYPSIQKTLQKTFRFMGPEISRMWLMACGRISMDEGAKYQP